MTIKTEILPVEQAAQIQKTVSDFNCVLREIGIAGNNTAKVTVVGNDDDVKALFESIASE